jgi:hypothetical protein
LNAKDVLTQTLEGGIELSLPTPGDDDFCSFAQKAFGGGEAKTGGAASNKSYFSV